MGKSLVIVESPAKAKTINKYLGNDFIVKSSIGHIRDLPTGRLSKSSKKGHATDKQKKVVEGRAEAIPLDKKQAALVQRMGINPYQEWQAQYEILPGKEKVVAELKSLAEKVSYIYLATDRDREGEAIAWHLQQVIGGDPQRYRRVVFNEITSKAIRQAFESSGALNIDRVNAQQTRRFLDRVVGYMVSPLLWKKIARGLSAGRVQSVAVRLVVERERDIKAFIPQEYWELHAELNTEEQQSLRMQVVQEKEHPFKPKTQAEVQAAIHQLEKSDYVVLACDVKPTLSKPPAPFITSTLQQAASTRIGFGVRKTMLIAQRLYEAGYITYMRTDSTHLSQEALNMARHYIQEAFGNQYLPKQPNHYTSKGNAQEAHEAIRPSDVQVMAEQLKDMDADVQKLYQLIWRQFVACQMVPAEYQSTTLTAKADDFLLKAKGLTLHFEGWTRVLPALRKGDEGKQLPVVKVASPLTLKHLDPSQHFTKPPARYGEASLVKELEKRGIGRPSTYATIISTIQDRGYVRGENRRFYAEKMGEIVTDRLLQNFNALMNYDFTARMESILDEVAAQKAEWKSVLDHFFSDFCAQLAIAEKAPDEGGMRQNQMVLTDINCSLCSAKMGIRTASTGVFLGCSGYTTDSTERCKNTINLIPEAEILNILAGEDAETIALRARHRCDLCGTAMDSYLIDSKNKLYVCGNNPICAGYSLEEGQHHQGGLAIPCDKCNAEMHLKVGRFGKYMGCSNVECRNTRKILRNGEVAPPKGDPIPLPELKCAKSDAYFILRDGAAGVFLAANTFPKSRESRAPLVEELLRFKERLPEKLCYLAEAPVTDPQGNKTVVKFSRKMKQQYVASETGDKTTAWSAFYSEGQWHARGQTSEKNQKTITSKKRS